MNYIFFIYYNLKLFNFFKKNNMKIAIDLNDVIRDFSTNFLKIYIERYNHEFDLNDFSFWTDDMRMLFPFQSVHAYNNFVYQDYAFELFGKVPTVDFDTVDKFNEWVTKTIPNIDAKDEIELLVTSTKEYGQSIPSTLFFLSKIGCKIRNYYFPKDSLTIWDKCDVLITANPYLIKSKPEGKILIKINTEYNEDADKDKCDYIYSKITDFFQDKNVIEKICL